MCAVGGRQLRRPLHSTSPQRQTHVWGLWGEGNDPGQVVGGCSWVASGTGRAGNFGRSTASAACWKSGVTHQYVSRFSKEVVERSWRVVSWSRRYSRVEALFSEVKFVARKSCRWLTGAPQLRSTDPGRWAGSCASPDQLERFKNSPCDALPVCRRKLRRDPGVFAPTVFNLQYPNPRRPQPQPSS